MVLVVCLCSFGKLLGWSDCGIFKKLYTAVTEYAVNGRVFMIWNGKSKSNYIYRYIYRYRYMIPWAYSCTKTWARRVPALILTLVVPPWNEEVKEARDCTHSEFAFLCVEFPAEPTQSLLPEHMQASFPGPSWRQNALQVCTPPYLRAGVCEECGLVMQIGESTCMHTRALLSKVTLEVNGDRPRGLGEGQANLVYSYLFRHFKIHQGWPPFVLLLQALQCWVV